MYALMVVPLIIFSILALVGSCMWFMHVLIEEERLPWQHKIDCPCGKCFARRMREAVEQAEYQRQEHEIREAVREVERATPRRQATP